ncbi:hypothetical protein OPIT5_29945 [Opitutaceae bacterium TAV5]|nr:hypothetical protein OPIT5_29945 [Opitutaceae bacterium TAV5]
MKIPVFLVTSLAVLLSGCGQKQAEQADEARRQAEIRLAQEVAEVARLRAESQGLRSEISLLSSELFRVRNELDKARDGQARLGDELAAAERKYSSLLFDRQGSLPDTAASAAPRAPRYHKATPPETVEEYMARFRAQNSSVTATPDTADSALLAETEPVSPTNPDPVADTAAAQNTDPVAEEKFDEEIRLMSGWKSARRKGEEENIIEDLRRIFNGLAAPSDDIRVTRPFPIYRDIEFLEDIESAKKKLGVATFGSRPFNLPGFPQHSFYVYRATLEIDGYQTMLILTDTARRIVAVQLSRNGRRGFNNTTYTYSRFTLHDMLNYATRAGHNTRVGWKTAEQSDSVVVLDSEFQGSNQTQYTRLYIARQIVALVLWNIRENW